MFRSSVIFTYDGLVAKPFTYDGLVAKPRLKVIGRQ
jgi:hypothetical protein